MRNDGRVEEKGKTQIEEMKIEEVGRKKRRRRKRKWKVLREKKNKNRDEAGGEEEAKEI